MNDVADNMSKNAKNIDSITQPRESTQIKPRLGESLCKVDVPLFFWAALYTARCM